MGRHFTRIQLELVTRPLIYPNEYIFIKLFLFPHIVSLRYKDVIFRS